MFKKLFIFVLLLTISPAGLITSLAQTIAQKQSTTVTIYRDLVRFVVPDAHQIRVEVFNQKQGKVFDSDFLRRDTRLVQQ